MELLPRQPRQAATDESALAKVPQTGITKGKGRGSKRKPAEITQVDLNQITTVKELSPEQTIELVKSALTKEIEARTADERLALDAQSNFVIQLVMQVQAENARLDELHNKKIDQLTAQQRQWTSEIQDLFNQAYESHNRMVDGLNTLPPEATQLLAEAFGSNDPNE